MKALTLTMILVFTMTLLPTTPKPATTEVTACYSDVSSQKDCLWAYCQFGHRYCKVGRTWKRNGEHCKLQ